MYVCGDDVIAYVHCIIVNMGHNIIMSKIINGYHTKHACGHYKDLYIETRRVSLHVVLTCVITGSCTGEVQCSKSH